jgi:hypothetical protein
MKRVGADALGALPAPLERFEGAAPRTERMTNIERAAEDLARAIQWIAQTVHQAHHEGHVDECPKATCRHVVATLAHWTHAKALAAQYGENLTASQADAMRALPSFACPKCGLLSFHPNDIKERYCVRCHVFFDQKGKPESIGEMVPHGAPE